jgi:uracil-DNA glycosylase family 4
LVAWREAASLSKRKAHAANSYWARPVPGFGDRLARIVAVGLAPGAHGSNRTGRQFTGDASGRFLYPALHRASLANQAESTSREDGLRLIGLYLTAACRCAPPKNKPAPLELSNCRPYLERELASLDPDVVVCLGRIAFDAVLRVYGLRPSALAFAHGAAYRIPEADGQGERWLVCSYHPSQQNTHTGRLTPEMFDKIWHLSRELAYHGRKL